MAPLRARSFFFFNDTATTEIYTLSLHDALPISGAIRDVRVLCERAEVATRMENTLVAPYGVGGGHAGRTGRVVSNPGTPHEREVPGQGDGLEVRRGDLLRFETCGGGGWGDPLGRDAMRVRQ